MGIKKKIIDIYERNIFNPGFAGIFVNAFYFVRRSLYKNVSDMERYVEGDILDVGCGSKPYEELFSQKKSYTGLEIDIDETRQNPKVDAFYDGKVFPFKDGHFDSVVAFEVLEHVPDPDIFLKEAKRVLKPGGTFLVTVPFMVEEHAVPFDYGRYTTAYLRLIFEKHGFEVIDARKIGCGITVISQELNFIIHRSIKTPNRYLSTAIRIFFISIINVFGILSSLIIRRYDHLYLGTILAARKAK